MAIKQYILGGGISGLIASYYTHIPIISKNIGGQMSFSTKWHLGPRYLHVDEWSTKLLDDLKIEKKIKTIKIGRKVCCDDIFYCKNDDIFRQKYYEKTRKSKYNYIPSSSSGGKDEFKSYDVSFKELIEKLTIKINERKNMIINCDVVNINIKDKSLTLDDGRVLEYDRLISTIPANIFTKLSNNSLKSEFSYLKKTFVLTNTFIQLEDYDYIYYCGEEPFHRITKCEEIEGHFVVEYVGDDFVESECKFNIVEKVELKTGQIQDNSSFTYDFKDITFLGRYAEWRHDILTNDIIKRSVKLSEIFEDVEIKICAFDLDGVLCEYPKAWVDFVNGELNTSFKTLNEIKSGINYTLYSKLKLKYRTSGVKAHLPILPFAREKLQEFKDKNYIVVILSARPVFEIKEVLRDTLFWLKNNNLKYDLLFWGEDKHNKILKYFPDLKVMVEDNLSIANNVAKLGYKVYLVDSIYNQGEQHSSVIRIKSLDEIRVD